MEAMRDPPSLYVVVIGTVWMFAVVVIIASTVFYKDKG